MPRIVNDEALDTLFRAARSPRAWLARPVSETMLRAVWELVKLGPTSGIGRPARILFIRSDEAKARLGPVVPAGQQEAIMTAPIVAIIGSPREPDPRSAAPRTGVLQAAYLILASRALGLDCAPIWDLDRRTIDAAFFPDGTLATNFLGALGYGDDTQLSPREPGPAWDDACQIL